ncbi:unnamed protein product [Laminaria digitata]
MSTYKRRPLSRRTFLRGCAASGAVALGLPLLEAMLAPKDATAADGVKPFFGVFYWANGLPWTSKHGAEQAGGNFPDHWTPTANGKYTPTPLLEPLAPYGVNVATNLRPTTQIPSAPPGQGDGHMRGFMVALTGDRPRSQDFNHSAHYLTSRRESIDQYVANHPDFYDPSAPPRYRSIEVGVSDARFHTYGHWNAISYNGPGSINLPIMKPSALYDRLFGVDLGGDENQRRALMLDAVLEDARGLEQNLGARDKQRLREHLEHVRAIERRFEASAVQCTSPDRPVNRDDLIEKTRLQGQLLAAAINCELTRVFSFMLTSPASTHVFGNLGVPDGMHKTCHDGHWQRVYDITRYQMQAFAAFLEAFDVPSPMGDTLLDRGVILGLTEYGEGWKHSVAELPAIIAGGGMGKLARGVHDRVADNNRSFSRAHLTALKALGLKDDSFGWSGGETRDPLSGFLL